MTEEEEEEEEEEDDGKDGEKGVEREKRAFKNFNELRKADVSAAFRAVQGVDTLSQECQHKHQQSVVVIDGIYVDGRTLSTAKWQPVAPVQTSSSAVSALYLHRHAMHYHRRREPSSS
uniref:Uncharacterized protein n=1 Tax=Vespula pensylvanica TaxID=30213 RepID=A0A834K661_VESPE|nr:hypothetical protein H0235_016019 [Vespula pensylvanica]